MDERAQEGELMQRVAAGDAAAFRALSDRHLGPICGYAQRILQTPTEAEDVAQEAFLRLWKQAPGWQPNARISTWLYRVAHNLCIDRIRKRREQGVDRMSGFGTEERPSLLLAQKQLADQVGGALSALPERQQAAITLFHYQGLSQQEIAQVLEVGEGAVESLLSRARRSLRQKLSSLDPTGSEA